MGEILGYLELSKGLHTLGVNSDDGFKLSFGPNPKDQLGIIAGEFNGGRGAADTTFNLVAEADGLYPVRLLWYEGGGGANVEFFSVVDGKKILINDPDNADAINALVPIYICPEMEMKRDIPEAACNEPGNVSSYGCSMGSSAFLSDGLFDGYGGFSRPRPVRFRDVKDGTSNTIMCVEFNMQLRDYLWSGFSCPPLACLLYTSPSPRDGLLSRMPSSA